MFTFLLSPLSLHFCCTSLGFRNGEVSFVLLWALEVSLFMNGMHCEFCDTKNECFPSWIVLATEFDFLESGMLNLAQLYVSFCPTYLQWSEQSECLWKLWFYLTGQYMACCYVTDFCMFPVGCASLNLNLWFISFYALLFLLYWCLSLSGQAKLGIHMIRLSQISAGSGSSDDPKSQTLVALLRLLESRVAFLNVFLRHHLFCILQVLSGRLVDWHLFLFKYASRYLTSAFM